MSFITRPASDFKAILSQLGYKKRKVLVCPAKTVTLSGLNWSDGSRSSYAAFSLTGTPLGNADAFHSPHPLHNKAEGVSLPIPPGACVVKHGIFQGKPSTAFIYINPEDMSGQFAGV